MIELLYEVVAEFNQEFAEDTFYVVPDHYIGEIAEHEVLDGHVSPYLNLWRWLMVYNIDGVCHPTEVEERGLMPDHGCPEAVSMTDSFYGSTIYDDCDGCQCEEYNDYGGWQLNWQCSNERYTPVGVHDQPVSFEQRLAAPASAAQECISGSELIDAVQSASGALDGENDHGEESVESIYWWSRCARYEKTGRLWSREGGDRGGVQWTLAICSLLLGGTAVGLSLKNAKLAAAKMVGSSKNENAIVAVNVAPEVTIVPPEPESGLAEKPELDVQGRSSPIAFAVQMVPMVSVQDEGSDATTTPPGAGVPLTPSKPNEPPTELGNPIPPPTPPPGAEVEVVASTASLDGAARYSGHKSERLEALTGARVIASTHIVFGHLYAKGAIESAYLFGWGYTWVPWFFMLSGYVLTHARLSSKSPEKVESPLVFFHKRTATIYPLYALGVLLMLGVRVGLGSELPGWGPLVAQAFLMQSFSPRLTEQVLQIHCWFLSTMVPYWFAFGPIYKRARRLSLERAVSMLCALAALPWLSLIVPAMAGPELKPVWWTGHVTGDLCEDSDVWIVFFKFHPISYAHVFIFGVVLAVLRARLAEYNDTAAGGPTPPLALAIRRVIRWGASIGYVGLLLVFCEPSVRPTAHKLSARLSILMPLQGLVLIGLSPLPATKQTAEYIGATGVMPIDPLARLFARAPAWLGDVSYAQYVFHMLTYYIWPAKHVGAPLAWLCFEVGGAMFAAVVIMKPAATAWIGGGDKARKDQKSRAASKPRLATVLLGMPSLLALTLVVAKAAYTPRVHVVKETVIPGYVRLAPEAVDMRLNWTSVSTDAYQGVLINPSFLANPADGGASILRAARVHSLSLSYRTLYTDEKYKPFSYAYYNDENDDNVDDLDDYDDEYYDDSEYYDEYYDDGDDGEGCWDDCASCQPAIQGDCLDDCEMSWEDNDAIQYCCFEFEDDAYPGDDFDPSDSDMCANSDAYDELTDSRRRLDELPGFDRSLCPFTAGSFGTTFACDAITHDAGNSLLWAYDDDEEKAFVLHIWNTDLGFAISFKDDNRKLKLLMVDASDDVDCDLSTCDAFLDDFDDEASICDEYEADKCKVDSDCTVTTTSSSVGGARAEQWYDSCTTTCGWEIPYNGYQALEYGNATEIVYQWNSR